MADAPRFRAYWENIEGRSVLTMARSDWSSMATVFGKPVQIDVARTPMAQVARDAPVIAAVAEQFSTATGQVSIFRLDAQDAPTPINLDKYTVWTDLRAHRRLSDMISRASTSDNT